MYIYLFNVDQGEIDKNVDWKQIIFGIFENNFLIIEYLLLWSSTFRFFF